MPGNIHECEVLSNIKIAKGGIWKLTLKSPYIATAVQPGQFVMLEPCPGSVLPRPFSVYNAWRSEIIIVYQVVGKKTEYYSTLKTGDKIYVYGPYGNPVVLKPDTNQLILIGGGCGLASLHLLARSHPGMHKLICAGFRSQDFVFGLNDFEQIVVLTEGSVHWVTEDDKTGKPKNAAELFQILLSSIIRKGRFDQTMVVTCGPRPMMQKVAQIAAEKNLTCLVGMEEMMGCGIGNCKSCAVHMVNKEVLYVCQHGPFFPAEEVFNND